MAFFVAASMTSGMGSIPLDDLDDPYELASTPNHSVKWAHHVKDAPEYRKLEFHRSLKHFKDAYEGIPEPTERAEYDIRIQIEHVPERDYQEPKKPVQFMIFGNLGWMGPKEFSFVLDDEGDEYTMVGTWEGVDIGDIHALAVGYEHESFFVETLTVQKLGRMEYNH